MTVSIISTTEDKPAESNSRLVLFDMDRTLLDVTKYHRQNFLMVLKRLYGVTELPAAETSGIPALEVLWRFAKNAGVGESLFQSRVQEAEPLLVENLLAILPQDLSSCVLPGAEALLRNLKEEKIPLGLITGTLRAAAVAILQRSGLLGYFPLTVFGDGFNRREQIVKKALEKAGWVYGLSDGQFQLFTVGDAPSDIQAGKAFQACTIGVATGILSCEELLLHEPDHVFHDLRDTETLMRVIRET